MSIEHVAYLGPSGTYTESALLANLEPKKHTACRTITEVFELVASGGVDAGFVPYENVLQGPVAETLDQLLKYKGQLGIVSSYLHKIEHALGVLPGVKHEDITQVYSHEQALRQCGEFLRTKLSNAQTFSSESTAAAAEMVLSKKLENAAVIGAPSSLKERGFEVLFEGISGSDNNQTRFILIQKGGAGQEKKSSDESFVTSLAIEPGRDRKGLLVEILDIISTKHGANLLSIHSRPDSKGGFVFFLDIEGSTKEAPLKDCIPALKEYCTQYTSDTAGISVFGSYPRDSFYQPLIKKILIVGGNGRMGKWFQEFFAQVGVLVDVYDVGDKRKLSDAVSGVDAVLLSIPMSEAESVVSELGGADLSGKLVVENCSIKNSCLPMLEGQMSDSVEILGIHTMFGEHVESLQGQNLIVTKTSRSGETAQEFEDILYKFGANIVYTSIEEHDKASSYMQSLFHLVLVGLAEVMRGEFENFDDLDAFTTPNARSLIEPMKRVVGQSESLLKDLQTINDQAPEMRKKFLQVFSNLTQSLDENDIDKLIESAKKSEFFLKES